MFCNLMYINSCIFILISIKVSLFFCNSTSVSDTFKGKSIEVEKQSNGAQKNSLSNENVNLESSSVTERSLPNKKETKNNENNINKKTGKKAKSHKEKNKINLVHNSNEKKLKTIKKVKKTLRKSSQSEESESISKSKSAGSEEPKFQLGEGETLLDFSALAKEKSLGLDHDIQVSSQIIYEKFTKTNPLLNWNCSSLSLAEEQNISTGYLDKRISHVITHAEDFPEGGTQLLDDMQQYYCYLKHVNKLVIDQVRRGRALMKQLVEEDPEFTQISFDTDELTEQFSWIEEEADAFEKIMDGICYQWKCLVARLKHK